MIQIIPAIDLVGGKCVRLRQGDYSRMTAYSDDPVEVARQFAAIGIKRIHMVDLDGARTGEPSHLALLGRVVRETTLDVDYGGGIRSAESFQRVIDAGAIQVSLGSIAVTRPSQLADWIRMWGPERFLIGADIREDRIVYNGWQNESAIHWSEFIARWQGEGVLDFFCTDVTRDGELAGPALSLYQSILDRFPGINLIASGGVSSNDDLMELEKNGIRRVIVGKALYEGRIRLTIDD